MMRFRLYPMVAVLIAVLLLTGFAVAQAAAPAKPGSAPDSAAEQQGTPSPASSNEQAAPEAPIEPVMSGPYPVMSKAAEDRGRQIFQMFNHSEAGQLYALLNENLKKRTKSEAKYVEFNKKLRERLGPETTMLEENIVPYIFAPDTVYSRLSYFGRVGNVVPVMTMITINQRGQIDAMTINPVPTVAEGRQAGYSDKNKLKLPFNDEWLVYQGGRNVFDNGYASNDDQRFALDFVYLKGGKLFSGKGGIGSKAEDYYCFGQPLVSPADGKVVKAEGGYDDNPPGRPSGDPADGNVISISFGDGEIATMNHLKQNSLKVKVGDQVKQGQELAQCGNSGGGPIPHVHFQLVRGGGVPLPVQFVDYLADGKPVASGEPKRGQMVKNDPNPSAAATTAAPAASPATPPPASK